MHPDGGAASGALGEKVCDTKTLVIGLDLAPIVCDLAGVEPMPKARGVSLRPLLEGRVEGPVDGFVRSRRKMLRSERTL